MSDFPIVHITAFTHRGKVRDSNEDSIAVGQWVRNRSMATPHQWRFALEDPISCVVADGMGGHAAGEIASQHVASRLGQHVSERGDLPAMGSLLQEINAELYDLMKSDPSRAGMGSTVVGLRITQDGFVWLNVGDSRLYQHRNGFLRQISIDDVPEASKSIDPNAPRRTSAITQSLGGTKAFQTPSPHLGVAELSVPSRWLLCSDGLTDMVGLDEMEACLAVDDLRAVSKLIHSAMEAGGDDNISIIIVNIVKETPSA